LSTIQTVATMVAGTASAITTFVIALTRDIAKKRTRAMRVAAITAALSRRTPSPCAKAWRWIESQDGLGDHRGRNALFIACPGPAIGDAHGDELSEEGEGIARRRPRGDAEARRCAPVVTVFSQGESRRWHTNP